MRGRTFVLLCWTTLTLLTECFCLFFSTSTLTLYHRNWIVLKFGLTKMDRVGVLLPDGCMLGLTMLSFMCKCALAPFNRNIASQELQSSLERVKATAVNCPDNENEGTYLSLSFTLSLTPALSTICPICPIKTAMNLLENERRNFFP